MIKLEEKYRGNYVDGIFFTESAITDAHTVCGQVKSDKNRINANLGIIKAMLAEKAKKLGADAIINFKYGQKSSFLSETKWFGEGIAIKL